MRKHTLLLTASAAIVMLASAAANAGTLSGRVEGAADGAALPGALVRVVETGQTAVAGQDGSFRIADLPAGDYTIEVDYLGYRMHSETVSVDAEGVSTVAFALAQLGAATEDLVVVRGTRFGQNRALNEQRTGLNVSNIVSADAIGKFPDNNIAESVSRLPGVTLVRDQQTGEGAFVTIRGLDTRLNVYTMNGVRMATASESSRALALNQLPPDGLQSVKVSKTITPDMDGDAIGGTVDFRTPSAFDYGALAFGGSASADYTDRNDDSGYKLSAFFADTFANDRLGFYVTGYYQNKNSTGEESENEGDWEPYHWRNGTNVPVDPQSFQMQGLGLDLFLNEIERYGLNSTVDYRFDDGSRVWVRGQYSFYSDTEDHTYFDVRNERAPNRLRQVDLLDASLDQPSDMIVGHDARGAIYAYTADQIEDVDGDGQITDADRTGTDPVNGSTGRLYSLIGASGVWDPQTMRIGRGFEWGREESELWNVNVGGQQFIDRLTIDWDAAYSYGRTATPYSYGLEFGRFNEPPFDQAGAIFSFPDPRFPQWMLPGTLGRDIYDNSLLDFRGASGSRGETIEKGYVLRADVTYDFEEMGAFNYVKFGGKLRSSDREVDNDNIFEGDQAAVTLADVPGIIDLVDYGGFLSDAYSGDRSFGPTFNRNPIQSLVDGCDPTLFATCETTFSEDDQTASDYTATETISTAYAMGFAQFGKFEVFGGVRVEHTNVENDYFSSVATITDRSAVGGPASDRETVATRGGDEASYTNWLPSIHFNYRATDNLVYRGAVWTSISRPNFEDITSQAEVTINQIQDADGSIVIDSVSLSRGNIDLKPTEATNFDLGFEYYAPNGGLLSANLFYKDISNFIFFDYRNDGSIQDTYNGQPAEVFTVRNGPKAEVYGIELGVVQQLTALPSPFDGFGFAGNLTLQQSEATPSATRSGGQPETVDLINAPEVGYNLQLFYEKYGFDARLSYNYSDSYVEDLRNNGVNKIVQDWSRLDFQARYTFSNGLTLRGEVQNILDEHNYWATRGEDVGFQKDYVENGRTFFVGVDWRF